MIWDDLDLESAGMRTIVFDINKLKVDQQNCTPPAHILWKLLHDGYPFDMEEYVLSKTRSE